MSTGGLEIVAVAEAASAATFTGGVLGHFALHRSRARRQAGAASEAEAALLADVLGTADPERAAQALARLPFRRQVEMLADFAAPLGRWELERIAAVAEAAGLEARARRWCSSRRWWRRMHGARVLTLLCRGDDVVPALLDDPHPDVRAEAAAWAATSSRPDVIERLLDMLGDDQNLCRFNVKDSLLRIGAPVVAPLRERLLTADGLALREALAVAGALAEPRLLEPALDLLGSPDPRVRALAADVVAGAGGEVAIDRLTALLEDDDAGARATATRGLGRLSHWRAAPRIAQLLRDPEWDVRRAAGVALNGLGAPGELLLRRRLGDADPFAADMARQILAVPVAVDVEDLP